MKIMRRKKLVVLLSAGLSFLVSSALYPDFLEPRFAEHKLDTDYWFYRTPKLITTYLVKKNGVLYGDDDHYLEYEAFPEPRILETIFIPASVTIQIRC